MNLSLKNYVSRFGKQIKLKFQMFQCILIRITNFKTYLKYRSELSKNTPEKDKIEKEIQAFKSLKINEKNYGRNTDITIHDSINSLENSSKQHQISTLIGLSEHFFETKNYFYCQKCLDKALGLLSKHKYHPDKIKLFRIKYLLGMKFGKLKSCEYYLQIILKNSMIYNGFLKEATIRTIFEFNDYYNAIGNLEKGDVYLSLANYYLNLIQGTRRSLKTKLNKILQLTIKLEIGFSHSFYNRKPDLIRKSIRDCEAIISHIEKSNELLNQDETNIFEKSKFRLKHLKIKYIEQLKRFGEADKAYSEIISEADKTNDKSDIRLNIIFDYISFLKENFPKSTYLLLTIEEKIEKIISNSNQTPDDLLNILNIAQFYLNNSKNKRFNELVKKAEKIYEKNFDKKDDLFMARIYYFQSYLFLEKGEIEKAKIALNESKKIFDNEIYPNCYFSYLASTKLSDLNNSHKSNPINKK